MSFFILANILANIFARLSAAYRAAADLAELLEYFYFLSFLNPLESAFLYFELRLFSLVIAGAFYLMDDAGLLNPARKTTQNTGVVFVWVLLYLDYRIGHVLLGYHKKDFLQLWLVFVDIFGESCKHRFEEVRMRVVNGVKFCDPCGTTTIRKDGLCQGRVCVAARANGQHGPGGV